jgi:pSer/pThr/pTyr-binding forkhead associated (FHA) protein
MSESSTSETAPKVAVHLQDTSLGRPIQSWRFEGKSLITIGRGEERDVQISDPYVSRLHAELRYANGCWLLVSLGRSGVQVHGHAIQEFAVRGDTTFRLGSDGPTLSFHPAVAGSDHRATMMFDATMNENLFDLDRSKLDRDVSDVTGEGFFQELQKRVKKLREERQ